MTALIFVLFYCNCCYSLSWRFQIHFASSNESLIVSRSLWCFNYKTSQVTTHFELLLLKPFMQAVNRLILYNKSSNPSR